MSTDTRKIGPTDPVESRYLEGAYIVRSKLSELLGEAFDLGLDHGSVATILREIADNLLDGSLARDPFGPRDSRRITPFAETSLRPRMQFRDEAPPLIQSPLNLEATAALERNLARVDLAPPGWASYFDWLCRELAAAGETALAISVRDEGLMKVEFDRTIGSNRIIDRICSATRTACAFCGQAAIAKPSGRAGGPTRCWAHMDEDDRKARTPVS